MTNDTIHFAYGALTCGLIAALGLIADRLDRTVADLARDVRLLEERRNAAATHLSRFVACRVCGCLYDRASATVPDFGGSGCCAFHRPRGGEGGLH